MNSGRIDTQSHLLPLASTASCCQTLRIICPPSVLCERPHRKGFPARRSWPLRVDTRSLLSTDADASRVDAPPLAIEMPLTDAPAPHAHTSCRLVVKLNQRPSHSILWHLIVVMSLHSTMRSPIWLVAQARSHALIARRRRMLKG